MLAGISNNTILIVWCDILRICLCFVLRMFVKQVYTVFEETGMLLLRVISQIRINTGIKFGRFVILIVANTYLKH